MSNVSRKISLLPALAALAFVASVAAAPAARAQDHQKSTSNEATWVKYDATAKTVTVKITKHGKGPNREMVHVGTETTFDVIPTGSILKRTIVKINGKKGELTDIPEGKTVLIYWVPDPDKKGAMLARSIDVVFSEDELNKRYPTE
jgi:hypothetical protein